MASSSSNAVRNKTLVSGCVARISRQASTPLPSGNRTSISTMSGFSRFAALIASDTVGASPATSMPASVSTERSPARTISWSSTSSTRIGRPSSGVMVCTLVRDIQDNRCTLARRGSDLELSPSLSRAALHIVQSAGVSPCRTGIESHAVVPDFETYAGIRAMERQLAMFGVRMPQGVAQGLAGDLQDVLRLLRTEPRDGQRIHIQAEAQRPRCTDSVHQPGKLGTQPGPAQNLRSGTRNVAAHVADYTVQATDGMRQLRCRLLRIAA